MLGMTDIMDDHEIDALNRVMAGKQVKCVRLPKSEPEWVDHGGGFVIEFTDDSIVHFHEIEWRRAEEQEDGSPAWVYNHSMETTTYSADEMAKGRHMP